MDFLLNNSNKLNNTFTCDLKQVLFHHLELKGIDKDLIPSFIRSMKICLVVNPAMNHLQVDKELRLLGWNDFRLDYHTLQLALAYLETEGDSSKKFN